MLCKPVHDLPSDLVGDGHTCDCTQIGHQIGCRFWRMGVSPTIRRRRLWTSVGVGASLGREGRKGSRALANNSDEEERNNENNRTGPTCVLVSSFNVFSASSCEADKPKILEIELT